MQPLAQPKRRSKKKKEDIETGRGKKLEHPRQEKNAENMKWT
jgi:hypothetical protein